MQDLFNKIVTREIPAHIIWENDTHLAFLDIKPIQPGHTLIIPKKQIDYIFDMSDIEYTDLMLAAKEVAIILKDKLGCNRVCVNIEGYAVPHAHVHLIPTNTDQDLKKENRIREPSEEDLISIKNKILN
jgi:histidine triad (HIT) family protein